MNTKLISTGIHSANRLGIVRGKGLQMRRIAVQIIRYSFLLILTACSLYPFLWMVVSSFKTQFEITSSALALPSRISFDAYLHVINTGHVLKFYLNSIIVTTSSVVLCVLFVSMASFVVSRYSFKLKNIIIVLFAGTLFLPGIALNYPVFALINGLGLVDKKLGLVIVYTCFGLPVTFFVMKSYYLSIPKEIDESAIIDGAGFVRIFTQILFPIAKPAFATVAILQFLWVWNEFYFCMLLTNTEASRTIPLSLMYFRGRFSSRFDYSFIVLVLLVLPTIIIFILLQEHVVKGLTAGAIKS